MTIKRLHPGPRMSEAVIHGDTVWLAGQVGEPGDTVAEQTRQALASVEALLVEAGSDKSRILQVIVWLADIADFESMNAVYDAWIDPQNPPARACGEARLAAPGYRVEFIVTAAR
ncbi:enamine deaminase RidA (YjgF/YER057c/UK114 family) [Pseudochelatococcus lubricantis]|uniref:Enamine deaminase RidA (YjgF/YER057c/UK114 family) n=1 Tax=Pseudochelatococcus lubricantis TaxID=1538102 RepID=A0ABX0V1N6_9HYPH|nr:RidA family protein [Pseudochelatococcus lubricantis]NIJ58857.1 enamine deaminase RidA (YjgF/YER057c/UK114 family) [Pseudochelatococcus lubricantis]